LAIAVIAVTSLATAIAKKNLAQIELVVLVLTYLSKYDVNL
jgi:hypothetical protein